MVAYLTQVQNVESPIESTGIQTVLSSLKKKNCVFKPVLRGTPWVQVQEAGSEKAGGMSSHQ